MSLKADGQTYSLKLTTEPIGGEDGPRSFLGKTDEAENTIVIDGTMPQSRQEEVALHEILHIVDPALPEFMVNNLGIGLYGVLKENGILARGWLEKIQDGTVDTPAMQRLNREAQELAQGELILLRVSERPWEGPALSETGELLIHDQSGLINRNAAHLAAAVLAGARGGIAAPLSQKRLAARQLLRVFQEDLQEPAPRPLVHLAG